MTNHLSTSHSTAIYLEKSLWCASWVSNITGLIRNKKKLIFPCQRKTVAGTNLSIFFSISLVISMTAFYYILIKYILTLIIGFWIISYIWLLSPISTNKQKQELRFHSWLLMVITTHTCRASFQIPAKSFKACD